MTPSSPSPWTSGRPGQPPAPAWDAAPRVRTYEGVDLACFEHEVQVRNEPAVLRGLAAGWPACRAATDSPGGLARWLLPYDAGVPIEAFVAPPAVAGRYFYGPDLRSFNFEKRRQPLAAFLAELEAHRDDPEPPGFYAGAVPVPRHLPGLPPELPLDLLPPDMERLVSLWLGNRSRTAAHYDLAQNIACVLTGRRRFILLPTDQLPNLYVGPLDFTLAGQPISLVDFLAPDFERHPRFADALDHARVADLAPGDAIYIPSLWWHHVESLDPIGAMVNFWWRDGPDHLVTPMLTLFHALLTLRDLPAHEREAWRHVFDHYIFERHGDPWAHVPREARGLFGELTPDKLARLRRSLARSLGS